MKSVLTCGHQHSGFECAHALLVAAAASQGDADQAPDEALSFRAEVHRAGQLDALSVAQPELCFVLVFCTPHAALARALQGRQAEAAQVDAVMAGWMAVHDDLLRFASRHPARCVLVDEAAVRHAPAAFLGHVSGAFGFELVCDGPTAASELASGSDALAASLAQALWQGRRDAAVLLLELQSQATLDIEPSQMHSAFSLQAWQQWVALQAELQVALDQARQASAQAEQRLAEVNALQSEGAELAARVEQLQAQSTQRTGELQQENELLLAQLHQVQEELETHYLGCKAATEAHLAEQAAHQKTQAAHADQAARHQAELKAALDKSKQAAQQADQRAAELQTLQNERKQLTARSEQLQSQLDAAKKDVQGLRGELAARPDFAPIQAQLAEATQESELLLLQLHNVQEELEHYFLQHKDLAAQHGAEAPMLQFLQRHWAESQPEELVIDLRADVPGTNWHEIEPDGRWAGPGTTSVVRWPALRPGIYNVGLDVVDAMQAEILQGAELWLNGQRLDTELLFEGFPALLFGNVQVPAHDDPWWELQIRFPRVMAPAERGEPDDRLLAVRARSIRLTWLEAA